METLLPRLTLQLEPGRDPRDYFDHSLDEVWLEVGFGAGEHLLWQAQHHPTIGIIGAEPFVAGMAKLLSKIAAPADGHSDREARREPGPEAGLPNIRIYPDDAVDVIAALPDASVGRVFILFPDPWPKTRHHKRRFLQTPMLDQLARAMCAGAELRFASDDGGYVGWALEHLMAHPGFAWTARLRADWRTRPADWPKTRYEEKALHGNPVYLAFLRTGQPGRRDCG